MNIWSFPVFFLLSLTRALRLARHQCDSHFVQVESCYLVVVLESLASSSAAVFYVQTTARYSGQTGQEGLEISLALE